MKVKSLLTAALLAITFNIFSADSRAAARDGGHDDNEVKFQGTIESLPSSPGFIGDWRVAGRTVHVTSATHIEQEHGSIAVGAAVKVQGSQRADSSVDASEIQARESAGSGGDGSDDGAGHVDFTGTIESLPGAAPFVGDWRVGGRTIHVSSSTTINAEHGPVAVGALVEIEGSQRPDGSTDATKIEVKSNPAGGDGRDELKGAIDSLPTGLIGDWKVAGRTVHVTAATRINTEHGMPAVGAFVEVSGTLRADGSLDASTIEVKSSSTTGGDDSEGQPASFKGTIDRLPSSTDFTGDWLIDGRTVHVVSSTRLKAEHGIFAVGTRVKVKGMQMADGSTVASRIQVKDN